MAIYIKQVYAHLYLYSATQGHKRSKQQAIVYVATQGHKTIYQQAITFDISATQGHKHSVY